MGVRSNIFIDIDVKKAIASLNQLEQTGTKTTNNLTKGANKSKMSMDQLNGAIGKTSQGATAGAVGFQTMSMGMLNLSTSAVQTFTSLSNLDRVQNRAAASAVGLQRAQDLLARKQTQLIKLQEAGNGLGRDAVLITKEITTATNDLAVKTDKLKIEQGAVTDVYLLFFANIANVGVSTMMVLSNMMSAEQIARVKSIVTTKLHTFATWENMKATRASTITNLSATGGLEAQSLAVTKLTIKTRLLTAATHGYKLALGPIGLILIGITAAMGLFTVATGGAGDEVNKFLGIELDSTKAVDSGTEAINEQTAALNKQGKAYKDLTTPMKNYIKMMEEAAIQSGDINRIRQVGQQFRGSGSGFSTGVGSPNTGSGGGNGSGISSGGGGSSGAFNSVNTVGGTSPEIAGIGASQSIPGSLPYTSGGTWYNTSGDYYNEFLIPIVTKKQEEEKTALDRPLIESLSNLYNYLGEGSISLGTNIGNTLGVRGGAGKIVDLIRYQFIKAEQRTDPYSHKPFSGTYSNTAMASRSGFNQRQQTTDKLAIESAKTSRPDPLGNNNEKQQFYLLPLDQQESQLRNLRDSFKDGSGIQNAYIAEYNRIYAETEGFRKQTDRSAMKIQSFNSANNFFGADMANGMSFNPKDRWGGYQPTGQSDFLYSGSGNQLAYYLKPGWNGERQAKGVNKDIYYSGIAGKQMASASLGMNFYTNTSLGNNRGYVKDRVDISNEMRFAQNSPTLDAFGRLQAQSYTKRSDWMKTNTNMGIQTMSEYNSMNSGYNVSSGGQGYTQAQINAGANANTTNNGRVGNAGSRRIIEEGRARARFSNQGGAVTAFQALNIFGDAEGSSPRSYGDTPGTYREKNKIRMLRAQIGTSATLFGSDETSLLQLAEAQLVYEDEGEFNSAAAARFLIVAQGIANQRVDRVENTLRGFGIDFDANPEVDPNSAFRIGGRKSRRLLNYNSTSRDVMAQIREDLQITANVAIPSADKLEMIYQAFASNGMYTNFNNTNITGESMNKLGLTEQKVLDIRFNATRGDRELENRLRYVEKMQAMSSGTSPI